MTRHHQAVVTALAAVLALAAPASAQQPADQRRVDSLAAEVRALKARLDSLRAQVTRGPAAAPARRDTAATDELAALRAAAAAAAGTDTAKLRADTSQPTRFIGRERSQPQLNPEISATGDVRAYGYTPGVQRDNFDAREFEVGFQSPLDPYSSTKIFVSFENGNVSIEEGYAYWTGLPGRIRFDIGKFRQQFGELNRWHLHALPETEYPLALRAYLGEDGLAGTGISLYRAFGGLGVHELTAQLTRSASDGELFGGGGRPTYLVHLLNFWQLTRSTYAQLRHGAVRHGPRLEPPYQGRRDRLPPHVAAAGRGAVPGMDAARRAVRAPQGVRRRRHDEAWLVRRHHLQTGPALDRGSALRLRGRSALRYHHAAGDPLAHAMAERVGGATGTVHLGQERGLERLEPVRPPSSLGDWTTQTRDLLTCCDSPHCSLLSMFP